MYSSKRWRMVVSESRLVCNDQLLREQQIGGIPFEVEYGDTTLRFLSEKSLEENDLVSP